MQATQGEPPTHSSPIRFISSLIALWRDNTWVGTFDLIIECWKWWGTVRTARCVVVPRRTRLFPTPHKFSCIPRSWLPLTSHRIARYAQIDNVCHGWCRGIPHCSPLSSRLQVAIKRIVDVFRYEMDTRRFLRELHILRRVKHPNIIHLLDLFVHGTETDFQELYLVFEVRANELAVVLRCTLMVSLCSLWTQTFKNFLAARSTLRTSTSRRSCIRCVGLDQTHFVFCSTRVTLPTDIERHPISSLRARDAP